MKTKTLPTKAPKFSEGEWIAGATTVVSCMISAAVLAYHIWDAIKVDPPEVKFIFSALGGAFAILMGLVPMSLARAHGSALEGGNAQTGLLIVAMMFAGVDGALQVHAVTYGASLLGYHNVSWVWPAIGAAVFQLAAFFVRGNLHAASREIQDLIDARAHDAEMAAAYAKEAQLAKRREQYAEKKSNVVSMR